MRGCNKFALLSIPIIAILINTILFVGLWRTIQAHRRRLYILGALTIFALASSYFLSLLVSPFINPFAMTPVSSALIILVLALALGIYTAGIPFAILLSFKICSIRTRAICRSRPARQPRHVTHMTSRFLSADLSA